MDRANNNSLTNLPKTKSARPKEAEHFTAATWLSQISHRLQTGEHLPPHTQKKVTTDLVYLIQSPALGKQALKTTLQYLEADPSQHIHFQEPVRLCLSRKTFPAIGPLCQIATRLMQEDASFAPKIHQGLGRILSAGLATADQGQNKYRIEAACTLLACAPELANDFLDAALSSLGGRRSQPSMNPVRTLELSLPEITERAPICAPLIAARLVAHLEAPHKEKAEDAHRLIEKIAAHGPLCAIEIGALLEERPRLPHLTGLPSLMTALLPAHAKTATRHFLERQFVQFLAKPETPQGQIALGATPAFLKQAPHTFEQISKHLIQALKSYKQPTQEAALKVMSGIALEAPHLNEPCALKLIETILTEPDALQKSVQVQALKRLLKNQKRYSARLSDDVMAVMDNTATDKDPRVQTAACHLITIRHIPYTMSHASRAVHHMKKLIASPNPSVSFAALQAIPPLCVTFRKRFHWPLLQDLLAPTIRHLPVRGPLDDHLSKVFGPLATIFTPLANRPKTPTDPQAISARGRKIHILDLLR